LAENPLLPSAELRSLYALLQEAESLSALPAAPGFSPGPKRRTAPSAGTGGRSALLSGTLLQLSPGDVLVAEPGDEMPSTLLRSRPSKPKQGSPAAPNFSGSDSSLLFATGLAAASKRAGSDRLVLTFVRAGATTPHWREALKWAQTDQLPLIVACADPSGGAAFCSTPQQEPDTLTWTAVGKATAKLKLPILSVDGEDAVAVYRVMQESVLRARSGNGPAILWAMLPTTQELRRSRAAEVTPLGRLQHFLRTRRIRP